MTIQQCKYVLKIAECGSFNEAAKQLFVAQSTLSVSVKSLEDELAELKMEGVLNRHRQRQITAVLKMIDHLSDEEE